MKPCRITFLDYMFGTITEGWNEMDLQNGIEYAQWLLSLDYTHEPA